MVQRRLSKPSLRPSEGNVIRSPGSASINAIHSRTRTTRPRVVCRFSRSFLGAAAVAASAARSLGRRHEARTSRLFRGARRLRAEPWSRFVCGPLRGPCRRGRPCGFGPQGLLCGLCALHAGAPGVRAPASSKRRPRPRVARGPWFQSSRPCCGLLRRPQLVRAWVLGRVARGGPRRFIPEALAPGNARASGRFVRRGRCHGPCFSPLAKTALGFATPVARKWEFERY